MTENDYLNVANLARLREAIRIISHITMIADADTEQLNQACRILVGLEEMIQQKLRVK